MDSICCKNMIEMLRGANQRLEIFGLIGLITLMPKIGFQLVGYFFSLNRLTMLSFTVMKITISSGERISRASHEQHPFEIGFTERMMRNKSMMSGSVSGRCPPRLPLFFKIRCHSNEHDKKCSSLVFVKVSFDIPSNKKEMLKRSLKFV